MGSFLVIIMALTGSDEEKLRQLCAKNHKDQCVWFLNGYWHKHAADAERIWDFKHKCDELDLENHEEGSSLDELNAHRFLEHFRETMTVREMREKLRSVGAIGEGRIASVPISHILIFRYNLDWHYLVNASQGDNKEEIEEAQRKLEAVQKAYQAAAARAQEAADALEEAKSREQAAVAAEAEAQQAKAELEVALAELQAQERAYEEKTATLTKKSEEGGVVSRNKAKAELAQHLAEDPLPLRKAKITQEAAVKRAERTAQAAADARTAATQATKAAAEAKEESNRAKAEAESKVAEAEAFLQEVKSKPGAAEGALWWIERELHEAKKYKPTSRGGISK